MDDTYRPVEEPFGPDEPDFTDDLVQSPYVDEVPEEAPPEDSDVEDLEDAEDEGDVAPVDPEFDDKT